jgi:hypothetical protein
MPFYDVYIGDLQDPTFHWEGGDWNGNVPHRLSPFFPPGYLSGLKDSFWALITKIETNIFDRKQTDWGGWVARISKDQLLAFIHELYGDYEQSPSLEELRDYVTTLDPEKRYALVATEL